MGQRWESSMWDPTLFAGAARYYDQGRLPLAPGLDAAMAGALRLDGQGRLLDVGCGPGTVALRLAHLFRAVVGVDADADMLAEAERLAAERGVTNAMWVHLRAEELPASLGPFRVAVIASSIHWMDQARVATAVASMLEQGGALVQVSGRRLDADAQISPVPFPPPPMELVAALIRRYLGPVRRAGQSLCAGTASFDDEVLRRVGLSGPEMVVVPNPGAIERTVDEVVAGVLSMSSSTPHLFGERLPEFVGELRRLLLATSPSGRFSVRCSDTELRIWRSC